MSLDITTPRTSRGAPQEHVVVVGYDGSPESASALEVAALRAGTDGTVVAVTVTPAIPRWRRILRLRTALEAEHTGRRLTAAVNAAELDGRVETAVLEGDPVDSLIRVAGTHGAQEIVVGSRGLGRVRAMLGSVGRRLLSRSNVPVTVVPSPHTSS